jgi:dienelactone hydrolase
MTVRARAIWGVVLVVGIVFGARAATRFWRAGQLLTRLVQDGGASSGPMARDGELSVQDVLIPSELGPIRARLYRPRGAERTPGIVVAHGVHHQGIDEKRLVAFARALAESGITILTPELRDLCDYRITSRSIGEIEDSVSYLASRADLVNGERVGLLAFSFAGGLSLLAAGEPGLHDRLSWVASVGGHHDLARVLRFFAANRVETPDGVVDKQAHEYGLAVFVYGNLQRFVPESDRELMREVLRAWLHEDHDGARRLVVRRRSLEAEHLFLLLESHRLQELRPELEALLVERAVELERLSPRGHLGRIACPVYLLHGAADSVIPASETEWADRELGSHAHAALVSPLLEHVEVSHDAELKAEFELVEFMTNLI